MKSNLFLLVMAVLFVIARPANSKPTINETTPAFTGLNSSSSSTLTQKEADHLVSRVKEIQAMDKRNLTTDQKRQLRNELIVIKKRLSEPVAFGIYVSGGALLLIIILLILLL